jgi:hypothetical protein
LCWLFTGDVMAPWLILVIGAVYLVVAIDLWWRGEQVGLALAFASYAVSNVGLYLAAK